MPHYEQAKALGVHRLPPEDQPRLFAQLGSTLRNLKKYDASAAVLKEGVGRFPSFAALRAFLGLTYYSRGKFRQAAKFFLQAASPDPGDSSMSYYRRALRSYEAQIDGYPARQRIWMRLSLQGILPPPSEPRAREIRAEDAASLARLMDEAYRGTIDHEGETLEQCLDEIESTLKGKYGALPENTSFGIFDEGRALAASMITLWKGDPLIAYTMTLPSQQGRGLAGQLILRSARALEKAGYKYLYLVVTEGNTAEHLYRKLGFESLGPAVPGRGVKDR